MEKLYYDRPYVKIFEAKVTACQSLKEGFYEIILDKTAFYPEGGGQPADKGILGEAAVLDVRENTDGIIHVTDKPLKAGSVVKGMLDWERRFCHMQNHSGEHLISGIVHKQYGLDNVGFHMGKDEVTVDFNGILTEEQMEDAETKVNEIIWNNIPIMEYYPSKEELSNLDYRSKKELTGQVRIIEIPGGDVCACCGTHVMSTGEIGILKVTGMKKYKGGVRVSMVCGKMALTDYRNKQKSVSGISTLLSVKINHVLEGVEKLKQDGKKKEEKITKLWKELLERRVGDYSVTDSPLIVFENGLTSAQQLRQFCTRLYEGNRGGIVLVCSGEENMFQYAIGSRTEDMRVLSRSLNEKLNGRGGGNSLMAQGTFQAFSKDIQRAFEEETGRRRSWS